MPNHRLSGLARLCACLSSPSTTESPRPAEIATKTLAPTVQEDFVKPSIRHSLSPLSDGLPTLRVEIPITAFTSHDQSSELIGTRPLEPKPEPHSGADVGEPASQPASPTMDVLGLLPADSQEQEQAQTLEPSGVQAGPAPSAAQAGVEDARATKGKVQRPKSPSRPLGKRSASRNSQRQRVPPPADLAAAMADLAAAQPVDAIADLHAVRTAALHNKGVLEPQLPVLVPLLLRALRAPRLGTTRAAILAFRDLFVGLGDAVCDHVADNTSATSCALLALLQKSTGGGLNNRKIADDANQCLIAMVEGVTPAASLSMLGNYCSAKVHTRVRAKAAALVAAAALRLAVTDPDAFDQGVLARCLQLCGPLLAGGASERQAAQKLLVVVHSVCRRLSCSSNKGGEDVWSKLIKMQVTPDVAGVIEQAVEQHAAACQQPEGCAELGGFSLVQPLKKAVTQLVLTE